MEFAVELNPVTDAAPAPGTYLDSLQVTASNYEEDTGRLTLQASLASDMYLASPYAEDYYQWEAKVSLTGQQGRTCTLTAGPGQPAWQQLQKEDGSARDVFASESLFTFDLETPGGGGRVRPLWHHPGNADSHLPGNRGWFHQGLGGGGSLHRGISR